MLAVEAVQVVDENVDQDQAVILQISFMNSNILKSWLFHFLPPYILETLNIFSPDIFQTWNLQMPFF